MGNSASTVAEAATRPLMINTCEKEPGYVDVNKGHVLADVRRLMKEEFDADMLPKGEYYFCRDGTRVSSKQERHLSCWNLCESEISIHEKKRKPDLSSSEETALPIKKARQEEGGGGDSKKPFAGNMQLGESYHTLQNDFSQSKVGQDIEKVEHAEKHSHGGVARVSSAATFVETMYDEEKEAGKEAAVTLLSKNHQSDGGPILKSDRQELRVLKKSHDKEECLKKTVTMPVTPEKARGLQVEDPLAASPTGIGRLGDEEIEVCEAESEYEAHKLNDQALEKSRTVLRDIDAMLKENPLFCSETRRQEWYNEIAQDLAKSAPQTTIGVLGNTGTGKSSMLNALIQESAVLPTSGSRGCTAAVVELRFNSDLSGTIEEQVPVYKGEVEFIKLGEWLDELRLLIDECSNLDEEKIHAHIPNGQEDPEAAAAWNKIEQVYGRGIMSRYSRMSSEEVYQELSSDQRVCELLASPDGNENTHNSIIVENGQVNQVTANALLQDFGKISRPLRRKKSRWAHDFRSTINEYVYRKGNGSQPQTWPLIRKVVLHGPWPVLSTGACLVDLPGVRDANVARARVSEQYLQNCSQIWIVAPIKRAVDDGTAKKLLGEQFKRRLLMDGQYGNVAFICTQTDDCEATETMRDHKDVALRKPGRWEKMTELSDKIANKEKDLSELFSHEEYLEAEFKDAKQHWEGAKQELKELEKNKATDIVDINATREEKKCWIQHFENVARDTLNELEAWKEANRDKQLSLRGTSRRLQLHLKTLCAEVRNEYSKECLQDDFRAGLEELTRREDEGGANDVDDTPPIPGDYEMDVYCISANDYLKIQGIKPTTDGPANTFSSPTDTQIPSLRKFVHDTTARQRAMFTEDFVSKSSDILNRVKLVVTYNKDLPCGQASRNLKAAFEKEMKLLKDKVKSADTRFRAKAEMKVRSTLRPAIEAGAVKGNAAAMATVSSWGSKKRRSCDNRSPNNNGLYWSTYFTTARHDGVYTSESAGEVDLNQELCDPMEKEFSADWQRIMDSSLRVLLEECEAEILTTCASVDKSLSLEFDKAGLSRDRITKMINTASRSCKTSAKDSFQSMKETAASTQRTLNRSLLRNIQSHMKSGYTATINVPGGSGKFDRMKTALSKHAASSAQSMFTSSTVELLQGIGDLIDELCSEINETGKDLRRTFESVYSIAWDNRSEMRACRNKLLPDLNRLAEMQRDAMQLLGIEREDMELDVIAVDCEKPG